MLFSSKGLLSVMYYWNKVKNGSLPSNEKRTMNMCTNEMNSDSGERKYIHLSNGLILSFKICYTFGVWIPSGFCGFFLWDVTPVHCSVVFCNYILPFFLYLKERVIILKFGSTVSCGLTRESRLTKLKPMA